MNSGLRLSDLSHPHTPEGAFERSIDAMAFCMERDVEEWHRKHPGKPVPVHIFG